MEFFIYLTVICLLLLISRYYWLKDKHFKWFRTLKPGDMVRVKIFSQYCDCFRDAKITSLPNGKLIKANLTDKEYKECEKCSYYNNEETCWYKIDTFKYTEILKK